MKAVAIILAAGKARRMSHPKALIEHEGGKSFLQSLASTFGKAGCGVLGVVGSDEDAVREQHPSLELVTSRDWEKSLLASVKAGLEAAMAEDADVVLVHPVDMPALRVTTVKSMLKDMERGGTDGVMALRPEYDNATGWPVVLSKGAARKLFEAEGEDLEAALKVINPRRLNVKDPGVIVNINTPEIYGRVFSMEPKLAPPPKRRMKRAGASNGSGADTTPTSYAASSEE
ncbi:purine catabolism protein PucB [Corallococcus sp. AB011P]|uniref:nucleotidyltransferase family protein n=1 Tax=unclassified Corallococcus TaxID=2685029 RepID=UPI000EA08C45|nr:MULTISPECIES: NTP transferase domain-containing protein [unclassified Corallococcus]RKG51226.1 purine catabolism protein PucB [Corallococcus sp. AB011P]RKH85473.1 purine catabolism protein PucB [Corallococcus sp. AB045]